MGVKQMKQKVGAYREMVKSGAYKKVFGTNAITIAFATTAGDLRVEAMRKWTRHELASTKEPDYIADLFLFTALPETLEPTTLFLSPVWFPAFGDKKVSLLGE